MEVVLLWLDDLDDVLFSTALPGNGGVASLCRSGSRRLSGLAGSELSAIATEWAPAFTTVAAGCVGAWTLGAALRAYYYRNANDSLTAALKKPSRPST